MSYHSSQDPEENLPEWLRALRKRQEEEGLENNDNSPADSSSADSDEPPPDEQPKAPEPDWLQEIRSRYQRGKKPAELAAEEASLEDTQPRTIEPAEPAPATQEEPPPVEEEVTASNWIEPEQLPAPPFELELPLEGFASEGELPSSTSAFTDDEPPINPGELPSWLQALRPGGAFPKEDARSGEMLPGSVEGEGPLAGLSDVLPADLNIGQVERTPVFSSRLEITDSQSLHAAAFTKLLEEVDAPLEDDARRVARPTRVLNIAMAAALLLSVLFPLLTGRQSAIRPDPEYFPEATSAYGMIDVLPAGVPVLIAFEVSPGLYGEMEPLVSAVFAHLLDRQAHLIFVSTQPTGPALVERVLKEHFASVPAVATGAYTKLGYLSGGMAALRSFISDPRSAVLSLPVDGQTDPWLSPALQPIQEISNFALVLVVSSNAEDGRAWIEQSVGYLPGGLAAVTSAQAGPLLRVYLQSNPQTLHGLVSGMQGAVLYERLRGQEDGLGRSYWDAYSYGLGAIVLMILLGGLYGRLIQLKPEKPSTAEAQRGA